jgi:hypothetical protein
MEKGIDIDDLVEAYEREHGTQAFVKARQEIARCLYGEGPETFTRLRLAAGKCVRHIATETGLGRRGQLRKLTFRGIRSHPFSNDWNSAHSGRVFFWANVPVTTAKSWSFVVPVDEEIDETQHPGDTGRRYCALHSRAD